MTWRLRLRRPTRQEVLWTGLVWGAVGGFVVLSYVVVVVGGGALLGDTSAPRLGLSVLATAVVALGFDPVAAGARRMASRAVAGRRPSPYDALRRFTGAVAGTGPAEDLPERLARLLVEGTGAAWAQVWVDVDGRTVPAAAWPPDAPGAPGAPGAPVSPERAVALPGTHLLPVLHGGERLGVLVLRERDGVRLTPIEERLFAGLATQSGLVLRGARLRAALEQRLDELSAREAELRGSRERLVDAQDEARRRLERDIHDGAQQHLVALAVNLRLAATLADGAPERADALLDAQHRAADDAIETLHRLARGIYPPLLAEHGVAVALRAVAGDGVEVVERGAVRQPLPIEAAAYFCCLEAIQNAAKHADATTLRVVVDGTEAGLTITAVDDGVGFDPAAPTVGTGLASIRDRIDSAGGTVAIDSTPGHGTRVTAVLPGRVAP
ncbi:sensor histidine kinase [Nocardioides sp. GY 10113]|uniref:GAF domain-containing sensor histidine kinase n=1 Tax=Nocardioides sp. GY 10113 TaxID=2569761 RepID=UPI0010A8BAAD|nr:sensor histidine kinase [Nocardioides sp. GY 10113]TIC87516.1 sensor histidine kinase [Nocardioides sp. GY 10113]